MIKTINKFTVFCLAAVWLSSCAVRPKPETKTTVSADLDFARMIQPVPARAILKDSTYFTWCGTMVADKKGKYHLFYSRFKRELGFSSWVTHSEVAHAVADDPLGPYTFKDVTLPPRGREYWDGLCTHNPTVHEFDGKYYLYYMGNTGDGKVTPKGLNFVHRNNQRIGVAVADSPDGPWKRFDTPLIDVSPDSTADDALVVNNPSITRKPDGGYLMVYKAVGKKKPAPFGGPVVHKVAMADSPLGPFRKQPGTVFEAKGSDFPAEDPFIWYQSGRYWAIVKDMHGAFTKAGQSLALFQSSDGLDWQLAKHPLVSKLEIKWEDGRVEKVAHLERPQLWLKDGKPQVLFLAADFDPTQSFNVHIPLKTN
jgi:predicted GH43/DUF377 family glycosyl hydrolase